MFTSFAHQCRGPRSSIRSPDAGAPVVCSRRSRNGRPRPARRSRCRSTPDDPVRPRARRGRAGLTTSWRAAATAWSPRSRAWPPTPVGALAIVPTGAGNDFARAASATTRSIRSTRSTRSASGHDRVVDLGRVNGRWYTCVTASGFDAEANRWANTVHAPVGHRALRRRGAAHARGVQAAPVPPDRRRRTARDAGVARRGRQRTRVRGRHARSRPYASYDDGLLDVTVVGALDPPAVPRELPEGVQGQRTSRTPKVHDLPRRARRAGVARPVGADGRIRRRGARRSAARRRWKRSATRCASACPNPTRPTCPTRPTRPTRRRSRRPTRPRPPRPGRRSWCRRSRARRRSSSARWPGIAQ